MNHNFGFTNRSFICLFIVMLMAWMLSFQALAQTPTVSRAEAAITKINADLKELTVTLESAIGDERDALQLKLFQKNEELRSILATAIEQNKLPKEALIEQVATQQAYSQGASEYLEGKIKSLSEKLNEAKDEQRLTMLNDYQELQHYLDTVVESSWQNIQWLKQLGVDETLEEKQFKSFITKRLRLVSASVEYFSQQIDVVDKQLSISPESEKSSLQLSRLVIQQRLNIAGDSLSSLVSIADQLSVKTAEYKRLMFEVTGSVTQDLLDWQVALSVVTHWSDNFWSWIANNAPQHLFQLFVFILILLVTKILAKLARKVVSKTVVSKNLKMSQLMQDFFIAMSGNAVWIIGILIGLSQIGLNLTPVLTGFGIAGVIVGFALQDTLSNFAAGMMLLIYRPFDVGDFVFAGGVDGKVSHMSLVNTTIKTFDNQIIIVPNGKIWGDVIKNVTHERVRRVDMVFGIGYSDDILKAEKVLKDIVDSHPAVLRNPEPNIRVHILNTSSVDFIVRPWVKTDDYWDVYWYVTREVKLRFDQEGISIPFPQQDVHLHMVKQGD
ncbi:MULTISPECIES: mechanosensitive ion channel family protein [Vibrio]|uniref:mechanosensitive ion channel family protein n=1 Tax=Vibrio TaxID=662 RepID=UPI0001B93A1E|nr:MULTISPECIES: mechanosensitive ion channel family protein [Vibrio]EEX31690.1 small-conductance mechanosensitive channel [Vibrio coralliilyticus ATCC BAA-450]MCM5506617.1 mechanosensitive ion channel [Vibrio sp. SCSIO 43169]MDE3898880.1 mechanosensitive ion channel [Vibrio sp. CC007]QFT37025.1 Small-conductance mechanosensitive channel [Vibrio sp. THAF64]QGM34927.1 Small-conductance mechanosensitive channel [Vibrio sp. THAF191d]